MEHSYFKKIEMFEFVKKAWQSPSDSIVQAPNLCQYFTFFNKIAYGVASEVMLQTKLEDRVNALKKFIYIASWCLQNNNFSTTFEIAAGLNLSSISRLKKTWEKLPKKFHFHWNSINNLTSNLSNYRNYRKAITDSKGPIIPYLGMFLTDLTFAEDGNKTFLLCEKTHKKTINFQKLRLISDIFQQINNLQNAGDYEDLISDSKIKDWVLNEWKIMSEKELYTRSQALEPSISNVPSSSNVAQGKNSSQTNSRRILSFGKVNTEDFNSGPNISQTTPRTISSVKCTLTDDELNKFDTAKSHSFNSLKKESIQSTSPNSRWKSYFIK
jgi:hypothetical protein